MDRFQNLRSRDLTFITEAKAKHISCMMKANDLWFVDVKTRSKDTASPAFFTKFYSWG